MTSLRRSNNDPENDPFSGVCTENNQLRGPNRTTDHSAFSSNWCPSANGFLVELKFACGLYFICCCLSEMVNVKMPRRFFRELNFFCKQAVCESCIPHRLTLFDEISHTTGNFLPHKLTFSQARASDVCPSTPKCPIWVRRSFVPIPSLAGNIHGIETRGEITTRGKDVVPWV